MEVPGSTLFARLVLRRLRDLLHGRQEVGLLAGSEWACMSDGDLARRAASGSRDAYSELVRRHSKKLLDLAWRMTGSEESAWDAVQEAFLAGWRGVSNFRGEAEFYSWIRRILVNAIMGQFRKEGRNKAATVSLDMPASSGESGEPLHLQVEDEGSDPQDVVGRIETAREIRRAVARLPDIYRTVFLLRETELMSYSQIAGILGIAEGTVKSRLNMARRMLRETLGEEVKAARFG